MDVTVIVPVQNARAYVDRQIASVKGQTLQAERVVIID